MKRWSCIVILLVFIIVHSEIQRESNKKKDDKTEKIDAMPSKARMKTMTSFRHSVTMSNEMTMDSPAPTAADGIRLEETLDLKGKTKKPVGNTPKEKEEIKTHQGPSLADDIMYSVVSSGVKSSLRYSSLLQEKQYKAYVKKIGLDVGINLGTKLVFRSIKGPLGNIVQLGLFIGMTGMNCKGKGLKDSGFYCLKQVIKLIFLIICGVISSKITKKVAIKAILYGIFTYFVENGITYVFDLVSKQ